MLMKPFTAIIVDDEQEARDIMANLVNDHVPEIQVVAFAASAEQAINLIIAHEPEIVFLDIDLPDKNGFEVVKSISINHLNTAIVFVTAFNQFAIEAIKFAAFDYLLKPVSINDLKACITRFKGTKRIETLQQSINKLMNHLNQEKLSFKNRTGSIYIEPDSIVYCEAEGNYTDLFLLDGSRHTVSQSLGSIESLLDGRGFSKISRSMIVNRRFLTKVNRKEIVSLKHTIQNLSWI